MDPTRREAIPGLFSGLLSTNTLSERVAELAALVEKQAKEITKLQEQLSWISRATTPVGTVIAYAAPWLPQKNATETWTEAELGWLLCDGRKWDDPTLKAIPPQMLAELKMILGGYYEGGLPDYCGYFLRGVDAMIDGKTTKGRDMEGIRLVGAAQKGEFVAHKHGLTDPGHKHDMGPFGGDGGKNGYDSGDARSAWAWYGMPNRETGSKTTGITMDEAGGKETRPINVAVYYLIKFRSAASDPTVIM